MKKRIIFPFLLLVLLLTNCQSSVQIAPTSSQQTSMPATKISTRLPSATLIVPTPRSTLKPPDEVPVIPSVSPTTSTRFDLENVASCVPPNGYSSPNNFNELNGTILYQVDGDKKIYYLEINSFTQGVMPIKSNQDIHWFGLSPDGKWLAYSPIKRGPDNSRIFTNPGINLYGSEGQTNQKVLNPQQFTNEIESDQKISSFGNSYWINNKYIFTYLVGMRADGEPTSNPSILPKIFDPFLGVWDVDIISKFSDFMDSPNIGFSPDMSRVFYQVENGYNLYALDTDKLIFTDPLIDLYTYIPIRWAPDSSKLVYTDTVSPLDKRLIHIMTRDGEKNDIEAPYYDGIGDFHWSPNSRYFAFVLRQVEPIIFIYDTKKGDYIYQCRLPGNDDINNVLGMNIIWSPDSSAIAFSGERINFHILKIVSGEMTMLEKNFFLIGWGNLNPSNTK